MKKATALLAAVAMLTAITFTEAKANPVVIGVGWFVAVILGSMITGAVIAHARTGCHWATIRDEGQTKRVYICNH